MDLLAISICADIVSITDENRVLVHYGLQALNSNPRKGIGAMIKLAKVKGSMKVSDVVFMIAPRINAAGRLESGNRAVEMLVSGTEEEAVDLVKRINQLNLDRRELDKMITQEGLAMMSANEVFASRKSTVLFKEDWHKGVIGIVASRIIETHYKPTIILTKSGEMATGSARSVKGFNVYNAIESCEELLDQFGGHKYAAGLSFPLSNLDAFVEKFEEVVSERIEDSQLVPQILIDAELSLKQINDRFMQVLDQLEPFGPGNMCPVFMTKNVLVTDQIRIVGNNHLKLDVFEQDNENIVLPAIAFNLGEYMDELAPGVPFDISYTVETNEWQGNTSIQLKIKDIRL